MRVGLLTGGATARDSMPRSGLLSGVQKTRATKSLAFIMAGAG